MFGTVLQFASGMPIRAPSAQSRLNSLIFQNTYANRVEGEPLWAPGVDINDPSTYDPNTTFVLNPNAWVDPPVGQYGTGAAYYDDYRYQRRPSEAMSLGRIFRIKEGITLNIRADFQNVFNRTYITNPYSTNAKSTQRVASDGSVISGFGYINTALGTREQQTGHGLGPRNGIIVARLNF